MEYKTSDRTINIFWTGGWDSTYRIIELSKQDVTITPIYCIDPERIGTKFELEAMQKIIEKLYKHPLTKAHFNEIITISVDDIPEDADITAAFKNIRKVVHLGSQYEWFARIAKNYQYVELGVEKPSGEYSGCIDIIEKQGALIEENGNILIDKNASSSDLILLFGHCSFPISRITESEMRKNITDWGYEDVMKLIWFCHAPIGNIPCGICRPCQQKMESNMDFLLPPGAKKRYHLYAVLSKITGQKMGRKIANRLLATYQSIKK